MDESSALSPEDATPGPVDPAMARVEDGLRKVAANIMRTQARRAWMVPLLAVPLAQLATAPEVPPEFLPLDDAERAELRASAELVLGVLARVAASPDEVLTDNDAWALYDLVSFHREIITFAFSFRFALLERLGLPEGLSGTGLVRRLTGAMAERPEPPALLALLTSALLEDAEDGLRVRDYVPLPHRDLAPLTRALDQRCFGLGLRTWEDGLRHAIATWSPDTWRGLLMAMSFGAGKQMGVAIAREIAAFELAPPAPAPVLPPPRPRSRPKSKGKPNPAEAEGPLVQAREERDAALAELASVRRREAEVMSARDRAQARVSGLDARVAELERDLQGSRGMQRALEADLRRLRGEPEPELPPDVVPEPLPADLLRGRPVFLFTGQARGGAREEMAESLRAIGADDLQVFQAGRGRPGPEVFPPGSVVVVDTRFVGHKHTDELGARVRRSPGVKYVALQGGEGGLAARIVARLTRD